MLVPKKISTKKLAIYIAIIIFMLGGIGFTLYENRRLTSRPLSPINNLGQPDNSTTAGADLPGSAAAPSQPLINQVVETGGAVNPATPPDQSTEAGRTKKNSEFDLTIFGSEKFKALKENVLIPQEPAGLGKRDPFQPN